MRRLNICTHLLTLCINTFFSRITIELGGSSSIKRRVQFVDRRQTAMVAASSSIATYQYRKYVGVSMSAGVGGRDVVRM